MLSINSLPREGGSHFPYVFCDHMANKASVVIKKAFANIGKPGICKWIDKYEAVAGVIRKHPSVSLPATEGGVLAIVGGKVNITGTMALTQQEALQLAGRIDKLNEGADHLTIKHNASWQNMYRLADRPFPFMDMLGAIAPKNAPSMPCHNCGIILPIDAVQVDHHMPQAGGEHLYTLKTLRALGGLTVMGSSGSKGTHVTALGALVISPKARARGDYEHLVNVSAADKWTTTEKGTAFLSLCAYGDGLEDVMRMCKNSLLNLVPLCGACNRIKSDWIKPIG